MPFTSAGPLSFFQEACMLRQKTLAALTAVALFTLFAPPDAAAQDPRGTLNGVVSDSSGAVMPGVTVLVKNTQTGVQQQTVTNEEGFYRALYLDPGTYSVTAELSGFKRFVNPSVRVGI